MRGLHSAMDSLAGAWLERADRLVYVLVAVLFLGAAVAMGVYSVATFLRDIRGDFPLDLITFINDLLLVLIILEVVGTVRSYLETGATSLEPFLHVGTISATRRILAIGAQSTLHTESSDVVLQPSCCRAVSGEATQSMQQSHLRN